MGILSKPILRAKCRVIPRRRRRSTTGSLKFVEVGGEADENTELAPEGQSLEKGASDKARLQVAAEEKVAPSSQIQQQQAPLRGGARNRRRLGRTIKAATVSDPEVSSAVVCAREGCL